MTPRQAELARHALGLTETQTAATRNYYVTGPRSPDYQVWMEMVRAGHAIRFDGARLPLGGDDLFKLTLAGARACLRPGGSLDPKEFAESA